MKKSNWHGGKGSTPRTNTQSKQYLDNWDKIFGEKNVKSTKTCTEKTQQETQKKE
jgi:hypothetical protein